MSTPVTALPVTLPANYCLGPLQEFVNLIIGGSSFSISAVFSSYVIGAGVPAVTDHDKLWFRTTDGRTYFWDGTTWITPYWNDPMGTLGASQFLPGKDAAWLTTVDHDGSVVVVGSADRSGPFWEEDVLMKGKFPLGYGTLQPSATAVGANETGGTDQTGLTQGQGAFGSHIHGVGLTLASDDSIYIIHGTQVAIPATEMKWVNGESDSEYIVTKSLVDAFTTAPIVASEVHDPAAVLDPIPTLPPFQSGVWAKRTARKYFSVS